MYQPPNLVPNEPRSSLAAQRLERDFIDQTVRVTIHDGRRFEGRISCIDSGCNIILDDADEVMKQQQSKSTGAEERPDGSLQDSDAANAATASSEDRRRRIGLAVLPGEHVCKVELKGRGRIPGRAFEEGFGRGQSSIVQ